MARRRILRGGPACRADGNDETGRDQERRSHLRPIGNALVSADFHWESIGEGKEKRQKAAFSAINTRSEHEGQEGQRRRSRRYGWGPHGTIANTSIRRSNCFGLLELARLLHFCTGLWLKLTFLPPNTSARMSIQCRNYQSRCQQMRMSSIQ